MLIQHTPIIFFKATVLFSDVFHISIINVYIQVVL